MRAIAAVCIGVVAGALALVHFLAHLHCAIPPGDAGELLAAAAHLVPAHPPGYPTFLVVYHYGSRILRDTSIGDTLLRGLAPHCFGDDNDPYLPFFAPFNAVSSFLSSSAIGVLVALAARAIVALERPSSVMPVSSLCFGGVVARHFATRPAVVEFSTSTEVFALHLLFLAANHAAHWRYLCDHGGISVMKMNRRNASTAVLVAGVVCCGVSLTNQQTSLFHAAPLAMFVLVDLVKERRFRHIVVAFCTLLCSAAIPYLFLPYFAWTARGWSGWGALRGDDGESRAVSATAAALLHHVVRADYGTLRLVHPRGLPDGDVRGDLAAIRGGLLWENLRQWWDFTVGDSDGCGVVVVACAALSIAFSCVVSPQAQYNEFVDGPRRLVRRIGCCLAVELLAFHYLANLPHTTPVFRHVYTRFWLAPTLHLHLLALLLPLTIPPSWRRGSQLATSVALIGALLLVAEEVKSMMSKTAIDLIVESSQLQRHLSLIQLDMGRAVIEASPTKNVIFVTSGDIWTTTMLALTAAGNFCGSPSRHVVVHVDREMFTYAWKKRELRRLFPEVRWPQELINAETLATDGVFSNVALLARDNVDRAGWSLFVLESPDLAAEAPPLRPTFAVVGTGFLYRVERGLKGMDRKQHRDCRLVTSALLEGRRRRGRRAPIGHLITNLTADSSVARFEGRPGAAQLLAELQRRARSSFSSAAAPPSEKRRDHAFRLALERRNPWEATILQSYALAIKTDLLRAAASLQECLGVGDGEGNVDSDEKVSLMREALQEIRHRLLVSTPWFPTPTAPRPFSLVSLSLFERAVGPFRDALDKTIAALN